MSILHKVVSHGRVHQLRLLLRMPTNQLKVNARDETEKTAVILCALIDDEQLGVKMLRMLLEDERTDHDASDNLNRNIFTYAIIKGRSELLSLLLENKATISMNNTDTFGLSNLHHAVINGDTDTLTMLVTAFKEMGISVDPKTPEGLTPLVMAIRLEQYHCANVLLLEGNANYLTRDTTHRRTARDWANHKLSKEHKRRSFETLRYDLVSRARTEQRITLRRRGERPAPRSALTAPTTGLPYLTTRANNRQGTKSSPVRKDRSLSHRHRTRSSYNEVEEQNAFKYSELKRLHMILDSKFQHDKAINSPKSKRVKAENWITQNNGARVTKVTSSASASLVACNEALPSIYTLLQQQMWTAEHTKDPILPSDCQVLLPVTRFNSAKTTPGINNTTPRSIQPAH
ncbi:uncharacterized protein LOC142358633 [Convolutriloba macropyga]|uniref:uncharacterized protein LOC142358633 n=1 Tax=Convolutriloba macropyga TaxID=536237 RepID=UPI003F5263E0